MSPNKESESLYKQGSPQSSSLRNPELRSRLLGMIVKNEAKRLAERNGQQRVSQAHIQR